MAVVYWLDWTRIDDQGVRSGTDASDGPDDPFVESDIKENVPSCCRSALLSWLGSTESGRIKL
jgi:hypothetical protein